MTSPDATRLRQIFEQYYLYGQLKQDQGAPDLGAWWTKTERTLAALLEELRSMPVDGVQAQREPNDLPGIRSLRPAGPRRMWDYINKSVYQEKLAGALLGRMAGNILGAPVEGCQPAFMENLARENGDPFPPVDYWKTVPQPFELRGEVSPRQAYTRTKMDGVPVDDDIAYTLLGLFIAEEHGPGFRTEEVGKAWLQYLPFAYTAEEVALKNLKAGIPALEAAERDNPYVEWIGADIRADPWGYLAPGNPELAAELAHRDACLSHRRQGIYGAMFFAAAIAAAFQVPDPLEAIQVGLTEIPADCQLAREARWALDSAPRIADFRQARQAVEERFAGMSGAHTLNNACLTIFGLAIGGTDFSRVIGETVAMGLDNDCTAATAGSIVGAVVGQAGIPGQWTRNFNDTIHTYLLGTPRVTLTGVLERFSTQAMRIHQYYSGKN